MDKGECSRHPIVSVASGSAAARAGLKAGDVLLGINGEPVLDEIDYQALIANSDPVFAVERGGQAVQITVRKREEEPLSLTFDESMTLRPRTCHNNCEFCFIAQMPPDMRKTLYVRDDDWRYSLMMGNYVTLTNVDDDELQRIIRRKASPLYISVHATDPDVRCEMMHNRFAGRLMPRLRMLAEAGIRFHCQIVLCPGRNDGDVLRRTLEDLIGLWPAARTVALVPVGLTRYRDDLPKLTPYDADKARDLLAIAEPYRQRCLREMGTRFVFPSDEFYCLSGLPLPDGDSYEEYPQIENGVGLLRRFSDEAADADLLERQFPEDQPVVSPRRYLIATGVSAAPFIGEMAKRYAPEGVSVRVLPVVNHFFGETVTVTGLLTAADVLATLRADGLRDVDEVLLCSEMLRHERDLFLDDVRVEDFVRQVPVPVHFTEPDGSSFFRALRGWFEPWEEDV